MPFARNRFFTGRDALLEELRELLTPGARVALTGMTGMGKTQTAVEFAYRNSGEFGHVLYSPFETREAVYAGFSALARELNLPQQDAQEQRVIVEAVRDWLARETGWLLILDNLEDAELAKEFIPADTRGAILFTTQIDKPGLLARGKAVEQLSEEFGARLLLARVNDCSPDEVEATTSITPQDRDSARKLWLEFYGYPLALDQAGAYCSVARISLAEYLPLYRRHAAKLLQKQGDSPHASVTVTVQIAMEKLQERHPAAADLLRACAFLAPEAIPEAIFLQGAEHLGEQLAAITDEFALRELIAATRAFSLLPRDAGNATLIPHRVVQKVIREEMPEEEQRIWMERVVNAVSAADPGVKYEHWPMREIFLPHDLLCAEYIARYNFETALASLLLNQTAYYLNERARYHDAEPLYQLGLTIDETTLGVEHRNTATSLNNLAVLYLKQGRYTDSEPLFQRALAIREKKFGAKHSATATSLNNLAALYCSQGRYIDAEPLYQRALAINEKTLGGEHPVTATSLNNLADLFRIQGRNADAEVLFQRALAIRKRTQGGEHPDTATSLNNLAFLFFNQGRYSDAEPMYHRALAICENTLGMAHPDTARSLNKLANLYSIQGRYAEAEPLLNRAITIVQKVLGDDHPKTKLYQENYAAVIAKLNGA